MVFHNNRTIAHLKEVADVKDKLFLFIRYVYNKL